VVTANVVEPKRSDALRIEAISNTRPAKPDRKKQAIATVFRNAPDDDNGSAGSNLRLTELFLDREPPVGRRPPDHSPAQHRNPSSTPSSGMFKR
jgi:hypothetical protein